MPWEAMPAEKRKSLYYLGFSSVLLCAILGNSAATPQYMGFSFDGERTSMKEEARVVENDMQLKTSTSV